MAMAEGMLRAFNPAPTISVNEGDDFYLSLTNVGMLIRPDLFDQHTVHWHGFPEASTIFDGVPDASMSVNMGATLTYYYKVPGPGTYMYHCHVEATEHIQMGMIGNLYVRPIQNETGAGPGVPIAQLGGNPNSGAPMGYTYNDGDASTAYDVEYPIQMGSFDSAFHDASETVQPLPFAMMVDDYPFLNGRGYPHTIVPGALPPVDHPLARQDIQPQAVSSLITADAGDRVLLRISNVNVTRFYTLATLGIQMTVVGRDAKHLRSSDGPDMYYTTNSVTLGGGEAVDAILDIPPTAAGETYFLYTTNLNYLSNGDEDFGGMMTEIHVNP
jgi:FtsP/CotA-like multicopper oxidase with cupredoxin domain